MLLNERHPVTGNPVAKVIWNPGREDSVDSDKSLGGAWAPDQLWSKLGIRSALQELLRERQFEAPVERAIFAITLGVKNYPLIDQSKVKKEARLDGKCLLRTSDDTLSPEDVASGCKQLFEAEDAIRAIKSTLDLRPMYHRVSDPIRVHVLLC